MKTGYVGVEVSRNGISVRRHAEDFHVTRLAGWGVEVGLAWGSYAEPWAWPPWNAADAWNGGHRGVTRLPFLGGIWFHVWRWPSGTVREGTHPARFYFGFKPYFVDPLPKDPWARDDERGQYRLCATVSLRRGGEGR